MRATELQVQMPLQKQIKFLYQMIVINLNAVAITVVVVARGVLVAATAS